MVLRAARSILLLVCLGAPLAAGAAVGDEAALARCDSLAAAGLHPEAVAEAEALLATVDARGDGGTEIAAEALAILMRSQIARGGRLDPSAATHAERLLSLVRDLEGPAGAAGSARP